MSVLEGEGPVMGIELKREHAALAGPDRFGLQSLARGGRDSREGPWEVQERVDKGRHLRAGAGRELEEDHSRGVGTGPFAMNRDSVGEGDRVVAHHKLDTAAVDDFL